MRILVTGGAGFVGSHIVDRLLADQHVVYVFDNLSTGNTDSLKNAKKLPDFKFVSGEIFDLVHLTDTLYKNKIDVVFHLAAHADVRSGTQSPGRDLEQNLMATHRVLEAMRLAGTKELVFSSTSAVYGHAPPVPTPENCPFPTQNSLYGASKAAAEGLISAYCFGFGIQATIFRFVPILGERYRHGHLFDFWSKLKVDPNHIEILGDGQQRKAYVYINDVMDAVIAGWSSLEQNPVNVFNVSNTSTCTVDQSLDVICEELDINPIRSYAGGEQGYPGDNPFTLLDCSRLRELGWSPKVSIQEAILRTVRSFA